MPSRDIWQRRLGPLYGAALALVHSTLCRWPADLASDSSPRHPAWLVAIGIPVGAFAWTIAALLRAAGLPPAVCALVGLAALALASAALVERGLVARIVDWTRDPLRSHRYRATPDLGLRVATRGLPTASTLDSTDRNAGTTEHAAALSEVEAPAGEPSIPETESSGESPPASDPSRRPTASHDQSVGNATVAHGPNVVGVAAHDPVFAPVERIARTGDALAVVPTLVLVFATLIRAAAFVAAPTTRWCAVLIATAVVGRWAAMFVQSIGDAIERDGEERSLVCAPAPAWLAAAISVAVAVVAVLAIGKVALFAMAIGALAAFALGLEAQRRDHELSAPVVAMVAAVGELAVLLLAAT